MLKSLSVLSVIITIIFICIFAGCGDDNSVNLTGPSGPTGSTGQDISATKSLTLYLYDVNNAPITTGFDVIIERTGSDTRASSITGQDTAGNGFYTFDNLTPGTYKAYIKAFSYDSEEQDITVGTDSQSYTAKINMKRSAIGATNNIWNFASSSSSSSYTFFRSSLYFISTKTGEATLIKGDINAEILAMDFAPDGTLYAVCMEATLPLGNKTNLSGSGWQWTDSSYYPRLTLYKLDPKTGNLSSPVTFKNDNGFIPEGSCDLISDISFNSKGELFAFVNRNNDNNDELAKVSLSDGVVTFLTRPSELIDTNYDYSHSISFNENDELFYMFGFGNGGWPNYFTFSTFYKWNDPEGTPSLESLPDTNKYNTFGGMVYSETDKLFFSSAHKTYYTELVTIDSTGIVTSRGITRDIDTGNPLSIHAFTLFR